MDRDEGTTYLVALGQRSRGRAVSAHSNPAESRGGLPQAYNHVGAHPALQRSAEVHRPASDLGDVRPLPVEHFKGRDLQGLEKERVATKTKKEKGLKM